MLEILPIFHDSRHNLYDCSCDNHLIFSAVPWHNEVRGQAQQQRNIPGDGDGRDSVFSKFTTAEQMMGDSNILEILISPAVTTFYTIFDPACFYVTLTMTWLFLSVSPWLSSFLNKYNTVLHCVESFRFHSFFVCRKDVIFQNIRIICASVQFY